MGNQLHEFLNKQIGNWFVLYTKLHHFHWYVKGPQFFTLHEKFEELYNEAAANVDELAERLLAIGGQPVSTLRESLNVATLEEAQGAMTAEQMVDSVIQDYGQLTDELEQGISLAQSAEDEVTGDLLIGLQGQLQKHVWMLQAYRGRDVENRK